MPPSESTSGEPSARKNIEQRVTGSFVAQDKEQAAKYIDWLYSAIASYSQNVRRTSLLLLALATAFELVNGPGATQISLGSFQIQKGSIVLVFLPALVSYLYLQIWIDAIKGDDMYAAFNASFTQWWPNGKQNDLNEFILPPAPLYWNTAAQVYNKSYTNYRRTNTEGIITVIFSTALLIGILLFEGQAYYVLYNSHAAGYYWFGSLGITLFCLTMVLCYAIATEPAP